MILYIADMRFFVRSTCKSLAICLHVEYNIVKGSLEIEIYSFFLRFIFMRYKRHTKGIQKANYDIYNKDTCVWGSVSGFLLFVVSQLIK